MQSKAVNPLWGSSDPLAVKMGTAQFITSNTPDQGWLSRQARLPGDRSFAALAPGSLIASGGRRGAGSNYRAQWKRGARSADGGPAE